jgi:STE24 endopeptidase
MDESIKQAKKYSFAKRSIMISAGIISLIYFSGLFLTKGPGFVVGYAFFVSNNIYVSIMVYLLIIGIVMELINFPLEFAGSFWLEHKYNLSRQSLLSWFSDYLKRLVISGILSLAMILIFYFLLIKFPRWWWIYAGVCFFLVSIVLAKVFPVLVIPMFYKLTRISDSPLKQRLKHLADKAGVKILDIYSIGLGAKTAKANAAVCGLGRGKKILLSDTLTDSYSQDEIEVTLAHELSHHRHNHFWKLNAVSVISMFLFLFLTDNLLEFMVYNNVFSHKYSLAAFPVIAILLMVYNTALLPVQNLLSRAYEIQADKDAIDLTDRPDVLAELMKKISSQNLADPSPSLFVKIFFYSHPPAQERIGLAQAAYKSAENV